MIEFYPQIKAVHVASVFASVLLFALRGGAVLAGHRWPHGLAPRMLSWTIDTTLLTAALMLFTLLPKEMFGNGWLMAKMVLLVVYVGLGSMALRRGPRPGRGIYYVAALGTFAFMVSIARAHHPLGAFLGLAG